MQSVFFKFVSINSSRMSVIDTVKQPISSELKQFNSYFSDIMKTDIPLLNLVMKYLLMRKGKQMRPILVFLSAKLHGTPNESTYTAASLIEILHTATLIHDDIVDESNERRGFFSINAIWKSKVAILIGDYLLAKGMLLAVNKKEYDLLNIVSDAVREMSEGELMQIRRSRKINITEQEYFEIIRKKTATLISCCSSCGAKSVGMPDEVVNKMQHFGEMLGISFQIKDDLLDYTMNSLTGKPVGKDIQENKLTLPLIHALQQASVSDRKEVLHIMNHKNDSNNKVRDVLDFIHKNKGIAYAEEKMHEYARLAMNELNDFYNPVIQDALTSFVMYTIERNK
jgi:octaprenyl-diphosphate synthase